MRPLRFDDEGTILEGMEPPVPAGDAMTPRTSAGQRLLRRLDGTPRPYADFKERGSWERDVAAIEAEAGALDRDVLANARIVAEYWRDSVMESDELRRTGMSHPVAMVIAALDGGTDPVQMGIPPKEYTRRLAALKTGDSRGDER